MMAQVTAACCKSVTNSRRDAELVRCDDVTDIPQTMFLPPPVVMMGHVVMPPPVSLVARVHQKDGQVDMWRISCIFPTHVSHIFIGYERYVIRDENRPCAQTIRHGL